MSTSGPVAPAPSATPAPNGAAPAPARANGPQNPVPASGPVRGPDGKFTSANPKPPEATDDPEIDLGDVKLKRSQLKSELGRVRALQKQLPEWQKKLAEADAIRNSEEQRKARYKSDLSAVFEDAGLAPEDAKRLASEYLLRHHIEPEQMSPEQKRLRELEGELQKRDAAEKAKQAEAEKAETQRLATEAKREVMREVASLIESGKLPKSPIAVKRVVERMMEYQQRDIQLPAEEALRLVRDEVASDTASLLMDAEPEALREMWGDERFRPIVKKFIAYGLAQAKSLNAGAQARPNVTPISAAQQKQPMSLAEYQEWREKNLLAGRK